MIPDVPIGKLWKDFDMDVNGESKKRPMLFFTDQPLRIAASPNDAVNGQSLKATFSTLVRAKGKDKIPVSDVAYLTRALFPSASPKGISDYIKQLKQARAKFFDAYVDWDGYCNPEKFIWDDEEGEVSKTIKGCGQKYGLAARSYKDRNKVKQTVLLIPKDADGVWEGRFPCKGMVNATTKCSAQVRVFPRLVKLSPVSTAVAKLLGL
jgi:hypothetical protein